MGANKFFRGSVMGMLIFLAVIGWIIGKDDHEELG